MTTQTQTQTKQTTQTRTQMATDNISDSSSDNLSYLLLEKQYFEKRRQQQCGGIWMQERRFFENHQ